MLQNLANRLRKWFPFLCPIHSLSFSVFTWDFCACFFLAGASVLIACFLILMKVKHSKQKKAFSVTVKRIFFESRFWFLFKKKKKKPPIQQLLSRDIKDGMRCKIKADIFKWIWSVCRWMKFSIRINVWQSTNRKKKCDFDLYVCCPLFNSTAFSYDAQ